MVDGGHGGGAFSGKDPSKVDRSAAYMCRWVAKNVVAAELADRAELQVAYAIGHPHPTSVTIDCFGTEKVEESKIQEAIHNVFNFKPAEIVSQLDLLRPIYRTPPIMVILESLICHGNKPINPKNLKTAVARFYKIFIPSLSVI